MLEPLGEHRVHAGGDLRDQHRAGGVGLRRGQRGGDRLYQVQYSLDPVDEQAEQCRYGDHDDEADDDDGHPQGVLGGVHRYPPSRCRPRCSPAMMMVACSMVVCRAPSGAVLRTAPSSAALIFGASSPICLASTRIAATRTTTASRMTPPIT